LTMQMVDFTLYRFKYGILHWKASLAISAANKKMDLYP